MKRILFTTLGLLFLLAGIVTGCSMLFGPDDSEADTSTEVVSSTAAAPNQEESAQTPSTAAETSTTTAGPTAPSTNADTPATSPSEPQAQESTVYEVQIGDTLWGIAMAYGVSLDSLLAANDIEDPNTLWVGQQIIVPGEHETVVQIPTMPAPPTSAPTSVPAEEVFSASSSSAESTPALDLQPVPNQALLEPVMHDWQKMNNCAPTTVAMALSYFDLLLTQFDTAPILKGGPNDKNVSPPEIVAYVRDQGFGGIVRVNGNREMLKQFVSNEIPVIVEQWLDRPGDELTGHYRLVRGYDEAAQEFIVNDSYNGPRLRFSYAKFDRLWRPFNRVYVPVYQPEQEETVRAIVGTDWGDDQMYERAVQQARAEIESLGDAYAWFNLGNSLLGLDQYEAATQAFDQAIEIGLPPRMFWYQFGAFEAFNATEQFQRVIDLSAPLTGFALEELHYQRGVAFEGLGRPQAALEEYQRAANLNSRLTKAAEAVARLTGNSS